MPKYKVSFKNKDKSHKCTRTYDQEEFLFALVRLASWHTISETMKNKKKCPLPSPWFEVEKRVKVGDTTHES